jgi:hypothetical protein
MEVYAYQAKDAELVAHATEMRKRAERRIGELIKVDREAGRLAKGGGDKRSKQRVHKRPSDAASLADQGVDKHLADRARKAAALPKEKFEARLRTAVQVAVAAVEGTEAVIKAARIKRHAQKKKKRAERELALAGALSSLPQKKYAVILADPEVTMKSLQRPVSAD